MLPLHLHTAEALTHSPDAMKFKARGKANESQQLRFTVIGSVRGVMVREKMV